MAVAPLSPYADYLSPDGSYVGSEDIGQEPMRIVPQLRLCHGTSKPVQEGKGKPGDLLHSLTGRNYGEMVLFLPAKLKWAATLFREQDLICASDDAKVNRAGIACRDCPEESYYRTWVENKPPECALNLVFIGFVKPPGSNDPWEPVQVPFAKTSMPAGEAIRTLATYNRSPLFASVYELSRKQRSNDRYTWWVFDVQPSRAATKPEMDMAAELAGQLRLIVVPVAIEGEDIPQNAPF